jgi:TRAP-type C4-dicarboxylate transport system permease small subunit
MQKAVEAYFHLLKIATVLCLIGMVILVFGNVVLRYGFNSGITISDEVSRLLFVYLTFLGAIVAMREHLHLGIDSVVKRLPAAGKRLCLVVSHLLMLFATWLFLDGSWQQAVINLDVKTPVTGISMAVFYGVGIIFSVSVGLILLYDLYRAVTGAVSEEELVMVKESEEAAELERLQKELKDRAGREHHLTAAKPT